MTLLRYKYWVRRLRNARLILSYKEAVNLREITASSRRYLICMPDHERNVSVAKHYLTPIIRTRTDLSISLVIPERYAQLFAETEQLNQIFIYPDVKNPKAFPVDEDVVSHILPVYDVAIDLNNSPHILSHYITASRGKKITAGFENPFTRDLFTHLIVAGGQSTYEKGMRTLLNITGL